MISLDEIIGKIANGSSLRLDEVNSLIDKKIEEMGGNISRTGAAMIVAREKKIDLGLSSKIPAKELKISAIEPHMGNVSFFAKIVAKYPVNIFKNEKREGKVQNILLGDETGKIRMSLWNEETKRADALNEGDVILVENPWIVTDNRGSPEIRLGKGGSFKKAKKDIETETKKTTLEGAKDGDIVSVSATVVEIFDRALVYNFCPECRERLYGTECATHGTVTPDRMLIVSGVIDDGTKTMNAVFFRDAAEMLIGKTAEKISQELGDTTTQELTGHIISKKFKIDGKIRQSKFSEELELVASNIDKI